MRTFLGILLPLFLSFCSFVPAFALTNAQNKDAEFTLNGARPEAMQKYQLGSLVVGQKKWVLKGNYSFARDGGAASSINLKSDTQNSLKLPKGGIVHNCIIDVRTAVTSGGSTSLAFTTGQSAGDLKATTSKSTFTPAGLVACIPVGTASTSIKLTDDRTPQIVITGEAVTQGVIDVLIEYYLGVYP